ncbi:hypothetical protein AU195_11195 [Mycobacterium sp. IS-1496]|uniref:hypothetical protein n=1 Tax=Mycobacterium sp. IS-1496 TaxID=1772284 RepID=UPI0007417C0A|nr:hypothetical protein [Mycobacterium sp. IS-1496]KUI35418.1 hypothetical protein AU195_11195 [Mycobacterium sp. IS-1496]
MDPLKKPEGISWDAATVELPEMPMLPPGQDAMSATISAVLPTLAAPLISNVAALQAKEGMFSGKLVTAQSAYQNADDSGGQAVGQITGMLGQLGQMGGQAASSAGQAGGGGQGGGMFGSLMQQAMQAAQQFGGQGGGAQTAGGAPPPAPAGQPAVAQPPQAPQPDDGEPGADDEQKRDDEQRTPLLHAEGAGPGDDQPNAGPAPVAPQTPATDAEIEDLARRML